MREIKLQLIQRQVEVGGSTITLGQASSIKDAGGEIPVTPQAEHGQSSRGIKRPQICRNNANKGGK